MKIKWKKLLALGLAFSMAVGSFSVSGMTAMAEETSGENVIQETATSEDVNLSLSNYGANITAGSEEGGNEAAHAVDGADNTRWATQKDAAAENAWLQVNLGGVKIINKFTVIWERVNVMGYKIQVSEDGTTWKDAYVDSDEAHIENRTCEITLAESVKAKYVKLQATSFDDWNGERNTGWVNVSVVEFEIWGQKALKAQSISVRAGATVELDVQGEITDNESLDKSIAKVSVIERKNMAAKAGIAGGKSGNSGTPVTFAGEAKELSSFHYKFEKNGETYQISAVTDQGTVKVSTSAATATKPNAEVGEDITLTKSTLSDGTTTAFKFQGSGYLHFFDGTDSANKTWLQFDRCSGDHEEANVDTHKFEIFKQSENAPEDSPITGYQRITELESVVTDDNYLIAKRVGDNYYLMTPTSANSAQYEHVAKIVNVPSKITVEGVSIGETSVVIGETEYVITVSPKETVTINLKTGESTSLKIENLNYHKLCKKDQLKSLGLNSDIVNVTSEFIFGKEQVTAVVDGGKYWLENTRTNRLMKNETRFTGLALDGQFTDDDVLAYLWTVTKNGDNWLIQNEDEKYLHVGADANGNTGDAKASLHDKAPSSFALAYNPNISAWGLIGNSASLNHHNNQQAANKWYAAGWTGDTNGTDSGSKWNLYKYTGCETTLTFTGKFVGTTSVALGDTLYQITVNHPGVQHMTQDVTIYKGGQLEFWNQTGVYTSYSENSNPAVADVEVSSDKMNDIRQVMNLSDIIPGKQYYLMNTRQTASNGNLLANVGEDGGLGFRGTITDSEKSVSNATAWTIECTGENSDANAQMHCLDANGNVKYFTMSDGSAGLSNEPFAIKLEKKNNTDQFYVIRVNDGNDTYLNDYGGNDANKAAGYTTDQKDDTGNFWKIYDSGMCTKVTLIGKTVGTTSVTVGNVTYNVTVKETESRTETVDLYVGDQLTLTNDQWTNFEPGYGNITNDFVNVSVDGKAETLWPTNIDFYQDMVSGGQYYFANERCEVGKFLKNEEFTAGNPTSGLKLGMTSFAKLGITENPNDYLWTVDFVGEKTATKIPVCIYNENSGTKEYLSIPNKDQAGVVKETQNLSLEVANTTAFALKPSLITTSNYILNNHGGYLKARAAGDSYNNHNKGDSGNFFHVYAAPHGSTDVTFTGKAVGTTTVTIGNVTYNITVAEEPSYVADFGLPMKITLPTDAYTLETDKSYKTDVADVTVERGNVVTYTLNKAFTGVDIVELFTTDGNTVAIKIYPATNVYYDASFAAYTSADDKTPWTKSWKNGNASTAQTTMSVSRPDSYGYDRAYDSAASGAMEVATSTTIGDVATFEFTGTAVDVYMNCTSETGKGLVRITVRNGDTDQVEKVLITDTEFKLEEDAEGAKSRSAATPTAYGVPVVSIGGLKPGNHTVTINHIRYAGEGDSELIIDGFRVYNTLQTDVDGVYAADNEANPVYETLRNSLLASLTADYKYPIYTENNPFYFPTTTKKNQTLEAEYATLINYVEENEEYALNVAKGTWASNGKFVDSLNNGDKMEIPYFAEKAGIYEVKVTYRSGDTANKLIWVEKEGKITADEIEAGSSNSATANETRTFELTVVEPGAGVLVFVPDENKSPQLDKFEIHLKEVDEDVAAVKPTVTPAETPTAGKYAEQIASGLLKDILGKEGSATGVAIVSNGQYADLDLQDFIENSSKNEIHLYPGQSLVFNLATAGKLQVGLRALNEAVTYKVNNGTETALESNVDMFYPITVGDNGTVTITNTGASGVLAVTKLKMSGNGTQANAIVFRALTEKDFTNALIALDVVEGNLGVTGAPEEWGGEGTPTPTPSASPTEEVIPSPTEEVLPSPTETEAPVPTGTEEPQPTETEAPVPTATEEPQPTETEAPTPSETETPEATKSVTEVFDDVYSDWYVSYVQFVYENGLMTGIKGTTEFQPDANITKAQVAQVLYNMEGQPMVTNLRVIYELSDIPEIEWYTRAVAWAYNRGIVTGDTNAKKFFPNADVTREQLALMMYRYAEWKEYDVSATSDFAGLQNAENVSNWAAEGMSWAVGTGLISGVEKDGVKDLDPQGNATRAQMAAILQRFCENN